MYPEAQFSLSAIVKCLTRATLQEQLLWDC